MTKVRVWVRCFHLPFNLHLHFLLICSIVFYKPVQQYSSVLLWSQCWYFMLSCFYTGPNAGIEMLLSSCLWKPPGIHDSGQWWVQCCCCCWFDTHFLPDWMRMTWSSLSLCSVCWWRIVTTDFCEDVTKGQAHWNAAHISQMVIVFRNWGNSREFNPYCSAAPFFQSNVRCKILGIIRDTVSII